jgi:glycosyltransferase involved in cell wall biosynthesis
LKKVNIIVHSLIKSGGMKILFEYGNRLVEKGHDVALFFPLIPYNFHAGQTNIKYLLSIYKERVALLLKNKKNILKYYPHKFSIYLVPIINNFFIRDADCTIASSWPTSYSVNDLKISKGKKFYLIQGYEKWNSSIKLVNNSYKLNLNRIVVSKYLKDLIYGKFGSNSTLIHNGINFNFFNNNNKKFNKKKQISFIYNELSVKNPKVLIDILTKIRTKYADIKIVGFGHSMSSNIPSDFIYFKDPSPNTIKTIYCNSDIFLFTSTEEGFGLPPAEAMACKCAVVTNKVGAIPDFSVHLESAIHADPKLPEELFKGICYLIENDLILKKISINGFKSVRQALSWEKSIRLFEELI